MANTILLKRGMMTDIENAVLAANEPALAWNAEKSKVELWVGTGESDGTGKVLVNPDAVIPTNVSDFTNDSGFQTASDVSAAIAAAIAGKGTASFEKVSAVPEAADAKDNVLYLVMNSETEHYDIYAKIDGKMEWIDDITVDLSGYVTTESLNTTLSDYVQKDGDKVLSDENYTSEEKTKLANISSTTGNTQTVSAAEKSTWGAKLDSSSTIDGGTF